MEYIKVKWIHSNQDEPILLYSELDCNRMETRKVEIFSNGFCGYADKNISRGSTRLGQEPIPSLLEIALDVQFLPILISREEFEVIWDKKVDR